MNYNKTVTERIKTARKINGYYKNNWRRITDRPPSGRGCRKRLIDEGNTIPFIARYRKEATGSLNDEILRALDERLRYLRGLEDRKNQVIATDYRSGKDRRLDWSSRSASAATLGSSGGFIPPL